MFFLIVNCLSACFDGSTALSAGCGCNIKPARGTGNFDLHFIRSGNRRKFTSMFRCDSLARPVPALPDARRNSGCPLQALCCIRISANRAVLLSNIGKTVFITERKTCTLELRYFIAKKEALWIIKIQSVRNYSFCNRLYIDN